MKPIHPKAMAVILHRGRTRGVDASAMVGGMRVAGPLENDQIRIVARTASKFDGVPSPD